METCCSLPRVSVNRRSTKRISLSLTSLTTSAGVIAILQSIRGRAQYRDQEPSGRLWPGKLDLVQEPCRRTHMRQNQLVGMSVPRTSAALCTETVHVTSLWHPMG